LAPAKRSEQTVEGVRKMAGNTGAVAELVGSNEQTILPEWVDLQKKAGSLQTSRITENELTSQSREFLHLLRDGLAKGGNDASKPAYDPAKQMLGNVSRSRALQGFSPRETATFIFSLKQPLFNTLNRNSSLSPAEAAELTWSVTLLLDESGVYTLEVFQKSREEVIIRQQREIAELSTPVVRLWDGILALPLIGALDSQRTQSGYGKSAANDSRYGGADCRYRYNWRANRRHAHCATSVEDHRCCQANGRQVSNQRYSSSNSPDDGASRRRVKRHFQGVSSRRLCRRLD
jgi:hypothetical protein